MPDESGAQPPLHNLRGERRTLSVLFADVVGSTRLAESMDPEDWTLVVQPAIAAMSAAVERYQGTVTQFSGDSVMAVFGAPRAHEDDPYRAVLAGLDMVSSVEELSRQTRAETGVDLEIRVGVNTGLAVMAEMEAGSFTEYTAIGDTANVAARIQDAARPGSVLITGDTRRFVSQDFELVEVGPVELKGKSHPVDAYEVVRARGSDSKRRGVPGLHSPMVGRDRELATLWGLLETASIGRGRVALVTGDPGIGKSRLLRELAERIQRSDSARWVLGRCVSYGETLPHHLVASLCRALVGATDSDEPEVVRAAVEAHIGRVLGGDVEVARHLVHLLGVGEGPDPLDEADPETLHRGYRSAIASCISATASEQGPLVLVCEDLHWADASSANALAELLPVCHDQPVLLVLTTRPDRAASGWQVVTAAQAELGDALTELRLQPLPEDDGRMLVANLLEIESLPHDLRRLVLAKAEGNPFFVEEVIRMLIERGAITRRGNRWVATGEIDQVSVPDTIQGLLAARLDALPEEARKAARVAAVIGRQFPAKLLEAVDPQPGGGPRRTIHPQLGVLEGHGLIRLASTRPDLEYTFRHALVHEVVYGSVLKGERRRLHGLVGDRLEELYPARREELSPVLARHFEEAGRPGQAAPHYLVAGRRALTRFALREAFEFFQRARQLVGEDEGDDARRLRVETAVGRVRAGRSWVPYDQQLEILQSALPDAEALGDDVLLVRLHLQLVHVRGMMGEWYETSESYRRSLDQSFRLVERIDDAALRAVPQAMMAGVRSRSGDYPEALRLYQQAVPALVEHGSLGEASQYAGQAAEVLSVLGRFEEADSWASRAAALAEESGDPNACLDADIVLGKVAAERGDLETALGFTERAIARAEDVGNVLCCLVGNFLLGDQQLRLARAEEAIPFLQRGSELAAYCQAGSFAALGKAWLASARAQLGQTSLDEFDESLATARAMGNRLGEGEVLRQRGVVRSADPGQREGAIADLEAAVAIFRQIGARPYLARALGDQGRTLALAERVEEAEAALREAGSLLAELGISPRSDSGQPRAATGPEVS